MNRTDPDTPPAHNPEPTTFSPGLIGFYASCAVVSLGAAVASVGGIVFGGQEYAGTVITVGVLMILVGGLGAFRFLRAARSGSSFKR